MCVYALIHESSGDTRVVWHVSVDSGRGAASGAWVVHTTDDDFDAHMDQLQRGCVVVTSRDDVDAYARRIADLRDQFAAADAERSAAANPRKKPAVWPAVAFPEWDELKDGFHGESLASECWCWSRALIQLIDQWRELEKIRIRRQVSSSAMCMRGDDVAGYLPERVE